MTIILTLLKFIEIKQMKVPLMMNIQDANRIFTFSLTLLLSSFFYVHASEQTLSSHDQWLKEKFAQQHRSLIPIVTVANIFFACNKAEHFSPVSYSVKQLITQMDKQTLADKTIACLGHADMRSEQAINFALQGCFNDSFITLEEHEKKTKLAQVDKALSSLTLIERQKSLTECTTLQAINYLK